MADTPEQARVRADVAAAMLAGFASIQVDHPAECPFVAHKHGYAECLHPVHCKQDGMLAAMGIGPTFDGTACEFDRTTSPPHDPCPLRELPVFIQIGRIGGR